MSSKKILDSQSHSTGHGTSRREFLGRSVAGFGGAVMLSHWLSPVGLLQAMAAQREMPGSPMIPFLTFDLAGGAALPGNFLVGGAGGPEDLLGSYDTLGWDPKKSGALDKRFGLPMAAGNVSQMLVGMTQTMSADAQKGLRMGSILHFSQDDSGSNPLSILPLVSKAGLKGSVLPLGLGLETSVSGGNSDTVLKDPLFQPLALSTLSDLLDANGIGALLSTYTKPSKMALANALNVLGLAQAERFVGRENAKEFLEITRASYGQVGDALASANNLDARADADAQQVYNINGNTDPKDRAAIFGSIVMNVLRGTSGPGALTIGGCDYHTGDQQTGDAKDLEIGQEIGRAVELAYRYKTPLFFHVLTDGGIFAASGSRKWTGDSGDKGMTVVGYYRPDAAPTYRSPTSLQVGMYTQGQGADVNTLVGGKPALAAYAVFANYLNACGRIADFGNFASGVFGPKELDSVLMFA